MVKCNLTSHLCYPTNSLIWYPTGPNDDQISNGQPVPHKLVMNNVHLMFNIHLMLLIINGNSEGPTYHKQSQE